MNNTTTKALVQTLYDYQNNRIRTANRLSRKKDDTHQNKEDAILDADELPVLNKVLEQSKDLEDNIAKVIEKEIKKYPVYTEFLKDVKGCGPKLSAVIIATIDIEKATTVSKIWQYAGLNPAKVKGKKSKEVNGERVIYETDEWIRGDKLTKGFVAPYNVFLKTNMLGKLADSFIKSKSPYTEFYYNMKQRLAESEKPVNGNPEKMWKNEPLIHRDRYAKRYMVKMFLADLYKNWRTIEGLPVRPPYQEEYLGHKHAV